MPPVAACPARLPGSDFMRLSRQDYVRFEAALGALYSATSFRVLQQRMLRIAGNLVGHSWVSYNETASISNGRGVSLESPGAPASLRRLHPVLHALWHEHPFFHPQRRGGGGAALSFDDCLPRRRVERLAVYNEYYRAVGTADQLATLFAGDGMLRCLCINRERRGFSARDRAVMNLLQPHLQRACRNVVLAERVHAHLALFVVGAAGDFEFVSDPAARWLRAAFGPLGADGALAPAAIRAWLRDQRPAAGRFFDPLIVPAGDRLLALRVVSAEAGRMTVVLEVSAPEQSAGSGSRLTPREREVLAWVADGKTNPEIALILAASRRTVEKHMERILAKLALENRAQAVRVALERGLVNRGKPPPAESEPPPGD